MILPVFRPMYHDELLYGWISDLARMNYSGDPRGIQRVANILFPYAYAPGKRSCPSKEALRMDFIRGVGESLRENRQKGYSMPDASDLLAYNTVLYSTGISRASSTQARYLHTALSTVYGDIMDMPSLPSSVKEIKICPACMAQAPYIRTWHHIPGVNACAVHQLRLINPDNHGDAEPPLPYDHPDVIYAKYCKQIYEYPSMASLETIKKVMGTGLSSDETAVLSRKSTNFMKIIKMLIRHNINYHEIVKGIDNRDVGVQLEGYRVIRESRGLVDVSCTRCGHVFTGSVTAIREGFGCPACMRAVRPDEFVSAILKTVGDGNYKLEMPFQGMGAVQDVTHISCGRTMRVRMVSRLWDKQVCRCETANRISDMQEYIISHSNDYKIVSYTPTEGTAKILHMRCGSTRDCNWNTFKGKPSCPFCRAKDIRERRRKKLELILGNDYVIQKIPPDEADEKIFTVMHTLCGSLIEGTLRQFQGTAEKGPRRCPICASYFKDERFSGITYEGKLYIEMKEWFKSHKTWVSRRHANEHTKKYYEALTVLEKAGIIKRVSPGIYSDRTDITVYDVLREKYLIDDNGKNCGRFTGKAADYLAGKGDDPEIITLETELLTRKSVYRTIICNRNVDVKGC